MATFDYGQVPTRLGRVQASLSSAFASFVISVIRIIYFVRD